MKSSNEKLNALLQQEEFCEKIIHADSTSQICEILHAEGVDVSIAEIEQAVADGEKFLAEKGYVNEGELSEEMLDMVAGGARNYRDFVIGVIVGVGGGFLACPELVAIGAIMAIGNLVVNRRKK